MTRFILHFIAFLFFVNAGFSQSHHPQQKKEPFVTSKSKDTVIYDSKLGKVVFNPQMLADSGKKYILKLQDYINDLTNKNTNSDIADLNIKLAGALFAPNSSIQVSRISGHDTTVNTLSIHTYLTNLKGLTTTYTKIEIKFTNIVYKTKIKMGQSGKLYATLSFCQRFTGIAEAKIHSYGDITQKDVKVTGEESRHLRGGHYVTDWIVKLGDITVVETISNGR